MAFKDLNGRITIDEVAAQNDIHALQRILEYLNSAKDKLNSINSQSLDFEGQTGNSISENSLALIRSIDFSIQSTEESIQMIKATVEKYKQIDQDLKAKIAP